MRPISLVIAVPSWHASQQPRRATYPLLGMAPISSQPWENTAADYEFTASPNSLINWFLFPPEKVSWHEASPLLPASPLSIFDCAMSPRATTFLLSRTPSPTKETFLLPASPLSPRFMDPRTPPCPATKARRVSVYSMVEEGIERNSSVVCIVKTREAKRLKFYHFLFLKKCIAMEEEPPRLETEDNLGEGREQVVWNRWTVIVKDARNGPGKIQGLKEKAGCMLRRVKGMVLRR